MNMGAYTEVSKCTDNAKLVLYAERTKDADRQRGDKVIDAGIGLPLSYSIREWKSGEVEKAIENFCEGLKPIGRPGDLLRVG